MFHGVGVGASSVKVLVTCDIWRMARGLTAALLSN